MDKIELKELSPQQIIPVDLYVPAKQRVPVSRQWQIEVVPEKGFFGGLFNSKPKVNKEVALSIANFNDPSGKLVFHPDQLISLSMGGNEMPLRRNEWVRMPLKALVTPFTMLIKTAAIVDCVEPMSAMEMAYTIGFQLLVSDMATNMVSVVPVNVNIVFKRVLRQPAVELTINPRVLKYDKTLGVVRIGTLDIRNLSDIAYTPEIDIDCQLVVRCGGETMPANVIWLDTQGLKVVPSGPNTFKVYRVPTNRHSRNDFRINVPVFADIRQIGNPYNTLTGEKTYNLEAKVRYNYSCLPATAAEVVDTDYFRLEKNVQQPQLSVSLVDRSRQEKPIANGALLRMDKVVFQSRQNFSTVFNIKLTNTAKIGAVDTGVVIQNFAYSVNLPPDTVIAPSTLSKDDIIQLQGAINGQLLLPNGENSVEQINLMFRPNQLRELYMQNQRIPNAPRNYNVMASVRVEFDYYIDERGDHMVPGRFDEGKQHFAFTINLPLYQAPNPEWLAVDFGTSAIVSQYGDGDAKRIIDLHAQKDRLYADSDTDTYEKDTPFLSSNIVFRNVQAVPGHALYSQMSTDNVEGREFSQLAVCLSPTTDTERANIRHILPYLKLLVGYDLLPNIENYKDFKYCCLVDGITPDRVGLMTPGEYYDDEPVVTPLAKVDKVFEEVYNQLFTYFIAPAIKDEARRINQIVLTIPNTYTPRHIERINGIVRKALKGLNIRTVEFVSESDAVACYYQKNWASINKRFGREQNAHLLNQENVLVYDMGAGTLDVTLFTRRFVGGKLQIQVVGKIGIAKAGNYLDALLASILARKIKSLQIFSDPAQMEGDIMIEAFKLKDFVKQVVKPALSTGQRMLTISKNRAWKITDDVFIDIETDILSNPEFVAYIQDCTSKLIENFRNFFDVSELKIDTVLLSGRSSKLKPLQAALHSTLKGWGAPNMQTIEVSALTAPGDPFDKAKTIVTEGAIKYASIFSNDDVEFISDNITANYGIIYEDNNGAVRYQELLNPRKMSPQSVIKKKGMVIKTYRTPDVYVNLSGSSKMLLVQAYTHDVARDWESGNREYITVMDEFDLRGEVGFDKKNAPLSIHVTEDNTLYLYAGMNRSEPNCASKIDINSHSNRMSLWPVMMRR